MMSFENNQSMYEIWTPSAFLFPFFALACERIFIETHNIENKLVIGPENIPFEGVRDCTFQPGNCTGWGSEGVNVALVLLLGTSVLWHSPVHCDTAQCVGTWHQCIVTQPSVLWHSPVYCDTAQCIVTQPSVLWQRSVLWHRPVYCDTAQAKVVGSGL